MQLGIESTTHSIVDKALGCLPTILGILDFSTIKNELFPVVAAVFSKTNSLGIKIRGLEAFVIFCGGSASDGNELSDGLNGDASGSTGMKPSQSSILDKYTVQEKVVPLLKAIKTKEPAVMMACLRVFRQVGKIADAEFLAMDVLPLLWSFSLGPLLNLEQFQEYMTLTKSLSLRIEQEQTRKLRELSSNSNGALAGSRSTDFLSVSDGSGITNLNGAGAVEENDFERLVLGKSAGKGDNMLGETLRPQPQRAKSTQAEASVFSWSTPALTPAPKQNPRAITPDHTLNSFATLTSNTNRPMNSTNTTLSSFSNLTPQPLTTPSLSSWSFNVTPTGAMPPPPQQQYPFQPSFSIPPPPTSQSMFPSFSIAPPPMQPSRSNSHIVYGGGLGSVSRGGNPMPGPVGASQPQTQKKGLDAYESLL